jgi:hypothetical protein
MKEWKIIDGFPDYEVSSRGEIRSLSRIYIRPNPYNKDKTQTITTTTKIIKGWLRKPTKNSKYKAVYIALRKNNKTYQVKLSHIVLNNFDKPRPEDMCALHNDGNSLNNNISNLRWRTQKENIHDCINHKKFSKPPTFLGENHHNSKFTNEDILRIRKIPYEKGLYTKLAKEYDCAIITISRIHKCLAWNHIKEN